MQLMHNLQFLLFIIVILYYFPALRVQLQSIMQKTKLDAVCTN